MEEEKTQRLLTGDSVKISYGSAPQHNRYVINWHLLNGGTPGTNGDYIGLWRSDDQGNIRIGAPVLSYPIKADVTDGNIILEADIGMGEYVFGYSQCGEPPEGASPMVSATLSIPSGEFDSEKVVHSSTSMQLEQADYSLAIDVTYPRNFDPAAGTWIGIFETSIENLYIKYKAPCKDIMSHERSGLLSLIINDFSMVRSTDYVIGFFVNGWNDDPNKISLKALATRLSFST
jgi:hypothetical protein